MHDSKNRELNFLNDRPVQSREEFLQIKVTPRHMPIYFNRISGTKVPQ
jgi:hypothetical protein